MNFAKEKVDKFWAVEDKQEEEEEEDKNEENE